ncbi:MAG TPA: HpsJ family protein [Oculatellaceae cyanobacterium]
MAQLESFEGRSIGILRFAGYGLLILGFFDYINIFVPPQFLNPVWEFQTLGSLVERVPVPFLGLVLVFYGEWLYREKLEKQLLRALSWACLLVGVLYLLLIPLGIRDSVRINTSNEALLRSQVSQQIAQTEQIEERFNQATSTEELNNILKALNNRDNSLDTKNPQVFKEQVVSRLNNYQKTIEQQSEANLKTQRLALLKKAVKWNLGALVSGVLFIYLWRVTGWARQRPRGL